MRSGKSLLGLAVVGQDDGARLGTVQDLFFDHDANELLALVLSDKDLFGLIDAFVVPWSEVVSVGSDVILVNGAGSKVKLGDSPRLRELADRETTLTGTQILTTDGQNLGTLADTCINEKTGQVEGYEVSSGFVADSLHGKRFLPAPPGVHLGHDAALVSPEAAAQIKQK